jgi:Permeases of the drug/metabolite transporter (DMT) superfamily
MSNKKFSPPLLAILAAILFGLSTPLAKWMLGVTDSIMLSAFLYLGSGLGVMLLLLFQRKAVHDQPIEAKLERKDSPWLLGAILCGGVAAPVLLMIALAHSSAASASLLLNFEGVATTLIAALLFKESVDKRTILAITLITLASIILSWTSVGKWQFSLGALGILAACALWGLDNNFTRNISAKNPLEIVGIKGLVAGIFSLSLALALSRPIPGVKQIILTMLIGFICYGCSIVLYVLALRKLGTARTSTLYAIAPFIGAIVSLFMFKEQPQLQFLFALPLMLIGAWLMLKENHSHRHLHPAVTHEHSHTHPDEHHQHEHGDGSAFIGTHSHVHTHEPLVHDHAHTPDIDHRHVHDHQG